ncbi:class II peroxidase [Periconia macrospinosa]|uniref:Peroxidase n=1 Tax=Periconia macrospinosa TaxID=97972 RepID=A0A2V1E6Y2_9PLEO|nr:class II peroxidase [Periconia macrospinosa]
MRLLVVSILLCALSPVDGITAHPDMSKTLRDIEKIASGDDDVELIGDIIDRGQTAVGKTVADILRERQPAQHFGPKYPPPGPPGSRECNADPCCVWAHVSNALTALFLERDGQCNDNARAAVRAGFHDAATWHKGLGFGGADGSLALSPFEIHRIENNGLEDIVYKLKDLREMFNVGMADMFQFAATHAAVSCPLGPRIRVFVGRKDSDRTPPIGLIPTPFATADRIIRFFRNKTIPPQDLVALLGAHTVSKQFFVNLKRAGAPQDSTPGVWDVLYYKQTLGENLQPEVFRFQSDINVSKDRRTEEKFRDFAGRQSQERWNEDYARAYLRLSLLGVDNINSLTECTQALPDQRREFAVSDPVDAENAPASE